MLVGLKGACDRIQALPETDFSDDLSSLDEEGRAGAGLTATAFQDGRHKQASWSGGRA
jgi:hypothetical protein